MFISWTFWYEKIFLSCRFHVWIHIDPHIKLEMQLQIERKRTSKKFNRKIDRNFLSTLFLNTLCTYINWVLFKSNLILFIHVPEYPKLLVYTNYNELIFIYNIEFFHTVFQAVHSCNYWTLIHNSVQMCLCFLNKNIYILFIYMSTMVIVY